MAKWNRNGEGYADSTAGMAIQKVSREERKIAIAKRRNCRRTTDEIIIHGKAVKMRKMTDEQMVHYVEDRVEKARSEGFNKGVSMALSGQKIDIKAIENEIGGIKGIGEATLRKVMYVLEMRLNAHIN